MIQHDTTLPERTLQDWGRIREAMEDLDSFWSEVDIMGRGPKWEELRARIEQLRSLLLEHFLAEVQFLDVLEKLNPPGMPDTAQRIRTAYGDLLDRLSEDISEIESHYENPQGWQEIREEITSLSNRLEKNERLEQSVTEKIQQLRYSDNALLS